MAALKAVHVSDVPNLDLVPENACLSLCSTRFSKGGVVEVGRSVFKPPKFLVIGHRGKGMNILQSSDSRFKAIKENSLLSFNAAAQFPIDFVEFDVQVTRDGIPIIFHDNFIVGEEENEMVCERRVTELSVSEFMSYGVQRGGGKVGRSLLRKTKEVGIMSWNVEADDSLCTLEEAFLNVKASLGFNIELKFDDEVAYEEDHLARILGSILRVVSEHARDRPIIFSSFQPDAALLVRKLQPSFPVLFLTNGGTETYLDARRNSLEEAMKLCLDGGLQGIVSEVRGVFRNPGAVNRIKESKLCLLTYGKLNNVAEAVYMQHLMGVEGVIVDFVEHITEAVSSFIMRPCKKEEDQGAMEEEMQSKLVQEEESSSSSSSRRPQFSQRELSFLLKLIPELIQQ